MARSAAVRRPTDPVLAALDDGQDLTVRAARMLKEESRVELGADLHVEKHIPSGGGLGGGSSDAAAVLLALNELWRLNWPRERLAELGGRLGADVPVFVGARHAFASGRGDRLVPMDLPPRWFLIVHPGIAVPTADVFADPELTRDTPAFRIPAVPQDGGRNDCEPVVRRRYPAVAQVLDWFAGQGVGARMTGTGSCVFASFETKADAQHMAERLPVPWRGFVSRGLDTAR